MFTYSYLLSHLLLLLLENWQIIFRFSTVSFLFPLFWTYLSIKKLLFFFLWLSLLLDSCVADFIQDNTWLAASFFLRVEFDLNVADCYDSQLKQPEAGYIFSLTSDINQVVIEFKRIGSKMAYYGSFQVLAKCSYLRWTISVLSFWPVFVCFPSRHFFSFQLTLFDNLHVSYLELLRLCWPLIYHKLPKKVFLYINLCHEKVHQLWLPLPTSALQHLLVLKQLFCINFHQIFILPIVKQGFHNNIYLGRHFPSTFYKQKSPFHFNMDSSTTSACAIIETLWIVDNTDSCWWNATVLEIKITNIKRYKNR